MKLGTANLEIFASTLEDLAAEYPGLLVVTSDSRGSGKLTPFGKRYPHQHVEVGIAEQNLVGMAAGLASTGKRVFAVSPSCFLTTRSLEQIKNDVCYSDVPVNLVGISAGVSYGALGSTHHSLHDIAALRAINNVNIVVPADNFETREAVKLAANTQEPFFIRLGKRPMYDLHQTGIPFQLGKGIVVRQGKDLVFVATGETVYPSLEAAKLLSEKGIETAVVSMPFIKPFDRELLIELGNDCRGIITVEEHSVHGGLGEMCASILMEEGIQLPFKIIGIPDEYTVTGSQTDIFHHYGISPQGLVGSALSLLATEKLIQR